MSDVLAKINEEARAIGEKIAAAITFDDDGDATLPETFEKELYPEDLPVETVKRVQTLGANVATGLALGLGTASLKHMAANDKVDRTTASVVFGNDIIRAAVDREIKVRVPGSNEEKLKRGNVSVKLESGAVAKRGDLKRAISHIADSFAAHFDK